MSNYSGLTIILSEPGRHDRDELISGYSGAFFWNLLIPLNRYNIHLTLASDPTPAICSETKVVILLGQKSLDLLGTSERLDVIHGYPIIRDGVVYIPTFTPQDSFDRQNYEGEDEDQPAEIEETSVKTSGRTQRKNYKFWLYYDVKKALRILKNGLTPYPYLPPLIYPSAQSVIDTLTKLKNQLLFIDIETDKNLNLTCFGFGYDSNVIVVPWKLYTNQLAYSPTDCFNIIKALAIAFRDNTIIAHNSLFDLFVLAFRYRIPFPRRVFDTMLAWSRIEPEVEKSLARVISFFTTTPYHKSEGVYDPKNHTQQAALWSYNAKDVEALKQIYPPILEEAKKLKSIESVNQVNESIPSTLLMMIHGIKLDTEKMKKLYAEFHLRAEQFTRCLEIITGREDFNPRSPKQVKEYLYDELQLEPPAKDPTNEKQLLKLLTKQNIPSIKLILAARKESKASSDLKFVTWGDNRKTTGYRLDSDTFRSRSKTLLKFSDKGYGGNLQNIDKEKIGEIFIPDEGRIFVKVDQAGADAYIVAYLCNNRRYRNLFLNGIKPHIYMGLILFSNHWQSRFRELDISAFIKSPINNLTSIPGWKELQLAIKSDNEKYYISKKTIHSASYGVKGPTLQMSILLDSNGAISPSLKECRDWLGTFHDTFGEIQEWHSEIRDTLMKERKLLNLFGYPRRFHEPPGDSLFKAAYAFIPQSSVAIITHKAITDLQKHIEENNLDIDILMNEHDSYLLQCKNTQEDINICINLGKQFMERKLTNFKGEQMQMKTGASIGLNLKEMKEI